VREHIQPSVEKKNEVMSRLIQRNKKRLDPGLSGRRIKTEKRKSESQSGSNKGEGVFQKKKVLSQCRFPKRTGSREGKKRHGSRDATLAHREGTRDRMIKGKNEIGARPLIRKIKKFGGKSSFLSRKRGKRLLLKGKGKKAKK